MNDDTGHVPERYHRQMLLGPIREVGQRRISESHALIVGCGALGSVSAEMLVRAGVGLVTIVDRDIVEWTNLQRQVLFDEHDAREGMPKAEAAKQKLVRINSGVQVRAAVEDFNHTNALRLAGVDASAGAPKANVILDGTDNYETRYLLNDLAVREGIPFVYAGAVATSAMTMTILPRAVADAGQSARWSDDEATPCLRCVFEQAPPSGSGATCDTVGVLGPVVAMIANMQCVEAIKMLVGAYGEVSRTLRSFDLWTNDMQQVDMSGARRDECPCCGKREFSWLSGEAASATTSLCGRDSVQVSAAAAGLHAGGVSLDLQELARRLGEHGEFAANRFLLRGVLAKERGDTGEPIELTIFPDGRTIVKGTTRAELARSIHAKYIGS